MAFDLDNLIDERPAGKRPKPFPFKFGGKTFTLPGEIDTIALRYAALNDPLSALVRLMGPEQFAELEALPELLGKRKMKALMTAYYEYVGNLDAGESSASSPSSKNTARPSKRTSTGTTRGRRSTK